MFSLIIIGITFIVFIIISIFFIGRGNKKIIFGRIEGAVYNKHSKEPLEGINIKIGELEVKGSNHDFISEHEINTDKEGKFIFANLEIKKYWVMAIGKGRKVLRPVTLTSVENIIKDVLLTL